MRILYVTADLPWPLTSGYLRHYHFIKALSANHRITLLSLLAPDHTPADMEALRPYLERLVTEPAGHGRGSPADKVVRRLRALVSGGDAAAAALGRAGARLAADEPFDVLLLSGKRTMPVLHALPTMPLVADLCDATSSRILGQMRDASPVGLPGLAAAYVEVRLVERRLMRRARHALFASPRDRDAIVGARGPATGGARPWVIPNGVDLGFWQRTSPVLGQDEIVLTGAMDYPPNVDAAVQLVERVLPDVQRQFPSARATIVGRDPSDRVRALAARPGVEVTGLVDDVRPYLDRAAVFAAPLRHGAGIQNKVLEAMAMDVPVVATPLAAAGLRTEDDRRAPIDVARVEDMAAPLVARLREAAAGAVPDSRRRTYVAEHFDWATSATRLERLLIEAADPSRAEAGA